jgi:23S rRNA (cytidine1920-2'-O)/16S rRNA (cytidine1409-2'-O)-methyltransferase
VSAIKTRRITPLSVRGPDGTGAGGHRLRLDQALVARGLAPSREQALRLSLAGAVLVDGRRADKAGMRVPASARIEVVAGPRFVGRGGDKLAHALLAFDVSPRERVCLDVGASTGGFTDCLLQHGARLVYAVDVGHGQIDASLRADPRVVVMEGVNARELAADAFAVRPNLATVDVSFISLEKVLPAVLGVLGPTGEAVALAKPQFEVGRGLVGKGGVVRDAGRHRAVLGRLVEFARARGWGVRGVTASPLRGPKGNREFFLHLTAAGPADDALDQIIDGVVGGGPA